MADDSIDLIKDEFDTMTDRLWRQILEVPPWENFTPAWNNQEG
jgi:hypothetical protein